MEEAENDRALVCCGCWYCCLGAGCGNTGFLSGRIGEAFGGGVVVEVDKG